ncbi:hypothetical protein [Salinigranum sp.]|uniref:hypothetical protein n=1 Tax=Salinigranum sp. TaxID=1966351 RepID=UPI00356554C0
MVRGSRRDLLTSGVATGVVVLAGCAGSLDGSSSPTPAAGSGSGPSTTDGCTATDPPVPTSAATAPRAYPERPTTFAGDTVRSFVQAYEKAYQYNAALAEDPQKVGRLNELEVAVSETTVESADDPFTVSVSGNRYYRISTPGASDTPTPTVTPLPRGRRPFDVSYVVTPTFLRREDVVVECW